MARSKLQTRLTRQLAANGIKGAASMADTLLKKRGQLSASGTLTASGKARQALGADGRAKDRVAKASGHKASEFKYSAKTNRATLKKR